MEVRKGEAGMRAWQANPGELYHQTSAERGGLWRLRGRPPQKLTGVGFTTEGFDFCRPYRRHARLVPQDGGVDLRGHRRRRGDRRLRARARRCRRAGDGALRPQPRHASARPAAGHRRRVLRQLPRRPRGHPLQLQRPDGHRRTRSSGPTWCTSRPATTAPCGRPVRSPGRARCRRRAGTTTSRGSCATCSTRSAGRARCRAPSSSRRRSRGARPGDLRPHRHRHRRAPRRRGVGRADEGVGDEPAPSRRTTSSGCGSSPTRRSPARCGPSRTSPTAWRTSTGRSRVTRCCSPRSRSVAGSAAPRSSWSTAPSWSSCSTRTPTRRDGSDAGWRPLEHVPHAHGRGGLGGHRRGGLPDGRAELA